MARLGGGLITHDTCVWRLQAWHLLHLAGSRGALGRRWRSLVAPGTAPPCVAGVALGDIHLRFTRLETSTCVWRGRRGAWQHLVAFGVAGVALVAVGWLWCLLGLSFLRRPATTFVAHYWKKLSCGVIRFFNYLRLFWLYFYWLLLTFYQHCTTQGSGGSFKDRKP